MAPLLILFVSLMPAIVPLLFAPKFAIIIPMSVCASAYIFFKAFTLPVAYLPLAKGHATTYMWTELIYDIFIALLIPIAFKHWGLIGAGYAISVGGLFDLLLIHSCYRYRYQFKLSMRHIGNYIAQTALFFSAVAAAQLLPAPWKWVGGASLFIASDAISIHRIDRETQFIQSLRRKIGNLRTR
jgi:O-antigen/teichoic acid export membrane protein